MDNRFQKQNMIIWARIIKTFPGLEVVLALLIFNSLLFAQAPSEWAVNYNNYEHIMTITGVAVINGVKSANPDNVIAAFINNECRGVTNTTEALGSQMFFLMVYSNNSGESVTFKLYNAGIDSIITISDPVVFSDSEGLGTVDEPYEFIANYYVNSVALTMPEKFGLLTNYPNPFNNSTNIRFSVSNHALIQLSVFNLAGNLVTVLVNERKPTGDYIVPWNGKDNMGNTCATGEYIIQMKNDNRQYLRKVLLIK